MEKKATTATDAYSTMDIRLGWQLTEQLEVSLVGRNLLEKQHAEITPAYLGIQHGETERSIYGKVTYTF